MVGRTDHITPTDRQRFERLRQMGCICCRKDGNLHIPAEIHHLVEGNRRLGHPFSLPLCAHHHRGVHESVWDMMKGPSLALGKRDFIAHYGTERELLAEVNRHLGVSSAAREQLDIAQPIPPQEPST